MGDPRAVGPPHPPQDVDRLVGAPGPGRYPFGRRGALPAARPARRDARPAGGRVRASTHHLAGTADRRRPRRGRPRCTRRAGQRRRPPRLAQLPRARPARAAPARWRGGGVRVVPRLRPDRRDRRGRGVRRRLPEDAARRHGARGRGRRRARVRRGVRRLADPAGGGRGPVPDPAGRLRRRTRRRRRRRAADRRPAGRGPGPADDGAAEDHQRRFAQHPDRLVRARVRRRVRPRRRQPDAGRAARADGARDRARAADRCARHR